MAETRYNVGYSGPEVVEILGRAAHGGELDVTIAAMNAEISSIRNLSNIAVARADAARAVADNAGIAAVAAQELAASNAAQLVQIWDIINSGAAGGEGMIFDGLTIKGKFMKVVDLYGLTAETVDTGLDSITRCVIYKLNASSGSGGGGSETYIWERGPKVAEGDTFTALEGAVEIYGGEYTAGSGGSQQIYSVDVTAEISGTDLVLTRTDTTGAPTEIQPINGEWIMILAIQDN